MRITFNGREYESVEVMPPAVREEYQRIVAMLGDRNQNGVPDLVEGAGGDDASGEKPIFKVTTKRLYKINGREYTSWDEIPASDQERLGALGVGPNAKAASRDAVSGGMKLDLSIKTRGAQSSHGVTLRLTWPVVFLLLALIAGLIWVALILTSRR